MFSQFLHKKTTRHNTKNDPPLKRSSYLINHTHALAAVTLSNVINYFLLLLQRNPLWFSKKAAPPPWMCFDNIVWLKPQSKGGRERETAWIQNEARISHVWETQPAEWHLMKSTQVFVVCRNPFYLILLCLNERLFHLLLRHQIAHYLLNIQFEFRSFNYWNSESRSRKLLVL